MDKEKAKFILRSFRPDGADTDNADFAEALKLATVDRDLGEWLMRERAFDAEFAEALARVSLPSGLRESVLLAMVQDGGGIPRVDLEEEAKIARAMASIEIPEGLRERVLVAMDSSVVKEPKVLKWWRYGLPLAAAAGVAFAFGFLQNKDEAPVEVAHVDAKLQSKIVPAAFLNVLNSPEFKLQHEGGKPHELISYLNERGLPNGDGVVPPGLEGIDAMGCRELAIDGKKGSLICFRQNGGMVHMVIFKRDDLKGNLPAMTNPLIAKNGEWSSAQWENDKYVCTLMSKRDQTAMAALF